MKSLLVNFIFILGIVSTGNSLATNHGDVTHQLFDQVLRENVADGKVDYQAINKDPRFAQYLNLLENYDSEKLSSKQDRLVFWINAYNALAIKGIIDGFSPQTLRGRYDYFFTAEYQAGKRILTLDEIEKGILIPLGEPRIHFAIVCASWSCPVLRSEAYSVSRLEQQLESNTSLFINNPEKNSFDGRTIYVSRIFEWFKNEFSRHSGSVQKYLANYVEDPKLTRKLKSESLKIAYLPYNWGLNGKSSN